MVVEIISPRPAQTPVENDDKRILSESKSKDTLTVEGNNTELLSTFLHKVEQNALATVSADAGCSEKVVDTCEREFTSLSPTRHKSGTTTNESSPISGSSKGKPTLASLDTESFQKALMKASPVLTSTTSARSVRSHNSAVSTANSSILSSMIDDEDDGEYEREQNRQMCEDESFVVLIVKPDNEGPSSASASIANEDLHTDLSSPDLEQQLLDDEANIDLAGDEIWDEDEDENISDDDDDEREDVEEEEEIPDPMLMQEMESGNINYMTAFYAEVNQHHDDENSISATKSEAKITDLVPETNKPACFDFDGLISPMILSPVSATLPADSSPISPVPIVTKLPIEPKWRLNPPDNVLFVNHVQISSTPENEWSNPKVLRARKDAISELSSRRMGILASLPASPMVDEKPMKLIQSEVSATEHGDDEDEITVKDDEDFEQIHNEKESGYVRLSDDANPNSSETVEEEENSQESEIFQDINIDDPAEYELLEEATQAMPPEDRQAADGIMQQLWNISFGRDQTPSMTLVLPTPAPIPIAHASHSNRLVLGRDASMFGWQEGSELSLETVSTSSSGKNQSLISQSQDSAGSREKCNGIKNWFSKTKSSAKDLVILRQSKTRQETNSDPERGSNNVLWTQHVEAQRKWYMFWKYTLSYGVVAIMLAGILAGVLVYHYGRGGDPPADGTGKYASITAGAGASGAA
ncbi:uncharacterized protein V1516DRAFT_670147 [Lipomyces oligophaga]|uniref:uncharacterized protein n=1 Tax=Lipomyces oligophaga TaxID=45792 RepID=UPI0034CF1597